MADLLSLGTQGVLAAQKQLNTAGHNIANANTKGYSRQSVEQSAADSHYLGGKRWGSGVQAGQVYRSYDKFAINEFNIATSLNAHAAMRNAKARVLDETMAYSAQKVPESLNGFFSALKALEDAPDDMGARKVVLANAEIIAKGLNEINTILHNQENDIADEIRGTIQHINVIGQKLAEIHQKLLRSNGEDNDLLDMHEKLINELSEYTQVTVTQRKGGSYNVLIGTGHTLVSGIHTSELTTIFNNLDMQKLELAMVMSNSIKSISHEDIQGKLGALFEHRDGTLQKVRNEMGLLAISIAMKLNEIQLQGYDLKGLAGKNIFGDVNDNNLASDRVIAKANSTADIAVYIEDLALLIPGDHRLTFDGSRYTLFDPKKNSIQVTPTGTPPTIKINGLSIQINAGLKAGEQVIIRPMKEAAGQIYVAMADASEIAAQGYITASSQLHGTAELKILNQGLQKEFQVVISADGTTYTVLDMNNNVLQAAQAYPPTNQVNIKGSEFTLTKGAIGNDRFVVSLIPADGDNSNLLRMQELQTQKIMYEGRSTILDVFEQLNSDVGFEKASLERFEAITQVELDAAKGRVSARSGVNLDEEAANLIKFQQAYMASSRVMSAANSAFQTLLNATN